VTIFKTGGTECTRKENEVPVKLGEAVGKFVEEQNKDTKQNIDSDL